MISHPQLVLVNGPLKKQFLKRKSNNLNPSQRIGIFQPFKPITIIQASLNDRDYQRKTHPRLGVYMV